MLVHLMITSVELSTKNAAFECGMLKYNAVLPEAVEALRLKIFKLVKKTKQLSMKMYSSLNSRQKLIVELFSVLANDPCRFLPASTREILRAAD